MKLTLEMLPCKMGFRWVTSWETLEARWLVSLGTAPEHYVEKSHVSYWFHDEGFVDIYQPYSDGVQPPPVRCFTVEEIVAHYRNRIYVGECPFLFEGM